MVPRSIVADDAGRTLSGDFLRESVAALRSAGLAVCRVPLGEKNPTDRKWTTRSAEPSDFGSGDQVGVLCGPLSHFNRPGHALAGGDLDAPEAVALADRYLPFTAMIDGRAGKPRSHRYYLVPLDTVPDRALSHAPQASKAAIDFAGHPGHRNFSFKHRETRAEVLKLVGTGGQCVFPPSVHHSGQRRAWDGGAMSPPSVVPFGELFDAASALAAACGAVPPIGTIRPDRGPRSSKFASLKSPFESAESLVPVLPVLPSNNTTPSYCKLRLCTLPPDVAEAVAEAARRTAPRAVGERNDRLWQFARELKGIAPDATSDELAAAFAVWWESARDVVRTKDPDVSWRALLDAWPRAMPIGALESARAAASAAAGTPRAKLLAACRVLAARSNHGLFDLSCRAAGSILGVSHVAADKHLKRLVADGRLRVASPGDGSPSQRIPTMYALGPC